MLTMKDIGWPRFVSYLSDIIQPDLAYFGHFTYSAADQCWKFDVSCGISVMIKLGQIGKEGHVPLTLSHFLQYPRKS